MSDRIYRKMSSDSKLIFESKLSSDGNNNLPFKLIKDLPSGLAKIVDVARACALNSIMSMRHGAVLFGQSGKRVMNTSQNSHGSKVCGYDVPAQHAEANCLQPIFHQNSARRRRFQTDIPRASVYREKVSCFLRV